MDFPMGFWLFWTCFVKIYKKKLTKKRAWVKYGKSEKRKQTPAPLQRNLQARPMDLKIYSLERNPRLWFDSWQSLQNYPLLLPSQGKVCHHSRMTNNEKWRLVGGGGGGRICMSGANVCAFYTSFIIHPHTLLNIQGTIFSLLFRRVFFLFSCKMIFFSLSKTLHICLQKLNLIRTFIIFSAINVPCF
jgi:hypothetical protein